MIDMGPSMIKSKKGFQKGLISGRHEGQKSFGLLNFFYGHSDAPYLCDPITQKNLDEANTAYSFFL